MATKHFSDVELACQHCGKQNPNKAFTAFMERVEALRVAYGKPLRVTSGYRCPEHPLERIKNTTGPHTVAAIDLSVSHGDAHEVLRLAFAMGFTGIGVNQKGNGRFIHLDDRAVPAVWSY